MTRARMLAAVSLCVLLTGCGDPVDRLLASNDSRALLWDRVAGSTDLSGQIVDRLLAVDSTRAVVLDHLLANGEVRQVLLARVATDRMLLDGAIHFAVQDSSTRDHVMTLVKGMEMAGAR